MKRLISLLLVVTLCVGMLSLTACNDKNETSEKTLLEEVTERGSIIIATEGTWAPWTYHDENDALTGFDIEVAKAVCEKMGLKAEFVEVEWDGILAGVESGRYDIAANGVEIDEERTEKYYFCDPYAYIHTALIVQSANEDIKSFEDLNGKTTANTLQSTYAKLAESYGATVTGVDDLAQTIELLLAGRIDATLNADVSYYDYLTQHPDAAIKLVALTKDASKVAFPVKKSDRNKTFIDAVNKALKELYADGTIEKLSIKFFGGDITKSE